MNELKNAIKNKNVILFIGAGISMNLNIPSWNDLIDHMSEELGYDKGVFNSYGNYLSLAEFYEIKKKNIDSLKSWMNRELHKTSINIKDSKIHKLIVDIDAPLIYTTNYDRWIEHAYEYYGKKYRKISNVGDLVNLRNDETQIIKFHGDLDDDNNSIVLTESSYFERLNFETPLDIKFRADSLGKNILFIGYSLSDVNIRFLFYKLSKLWEDSNINNRPKSYIFLRKPNPIQEAVLKKRGINAIISKKENITEGLEELLEELIYK
ncbi:hypothetical protein CLOBY_24390 [Clostridium saccharobutylicum]|uniref:SIR2 family protein n=1 Tax=Clostridium saccharobutylicum TaxID=169679 RepID=UPI000983B48A|nr:SIR2 family protein [Clostridium saccharobutylicum]AQS10296.1 hypothetical protein CLOBY_24390 [Clostridium saccharobutylicum]MBC2436562.1 Sir2 family NAD-dependent protein deacetylase [Clostridium saccharobutylicum]NSB87694.1 hypothetical protein [Clostridium saccharobutylicum]NYC31230.1 hypothetical protein [Clostridium saccharobutylicum]OOM17427.1 hypothetical protein CLSAB_16770 [Clostridium saccharobutylicum]